MTVHNCALLSIAVCDCLSLVVSVVVAVNQVVLLFIGTALVHGLAAVMYQNAREYGLVVDGGKGGTNLLNSRGPQTTPPRQRQWCTRRLGNMV
jgi:hypothetical protein